ncbi:MAG: hypothetical protein ABR915_02325, partial [Thermoguttaceae bacterium]
MSTDELVRQNELADALLEKLARIKSLWDEMPGAEELEAMEAAVAKGLENLHDGEMHDEGQWCNTVGELTEFLRDVAPDTCIAMADLAAIYVVKDMSPDQERLVV